MQNILKKYNGSETKNENYDKTNENNDEISEDNSNIRKEWS